MNIEIAPPRLAPLLVVRDAARAVEFYAVALGATEITRYIDKTNSAISHADLAAGDATFSVTEEARAWNSHAPPSLGGSPVVLQLQLGDVDSAFARMCEAGSVVVFPLQEFCGQRMGRVRDPFGHLWLLSQRVADLTVQQTQLQRDAWTQAGHASKMSTTILDGDGGPQALARDRSPVDRGTPAESARSASGRIHLVVGPVGAGKSTFALALSRRLRALRFNLDEWMADLFRPDRPETGLADWYVERAERCVEQIWKLCTRAIDAGTDVVLEIGLIRRGDRERLYGRVDAAGYELVVHALDAPRETRRQRVERRNREKGDTFSMEVPPHVFETASDMWEPPDEIECAARDVRRGPMEVRGEPPSRKAAK